VVPLLFIKALNLSQGQKRLETVIGALMSKVKLTDIDVHHPSHWTLKAPLLLSLS
jgi:hypothetical protein